VFDAWLDPSLVGRWMFAFRGDEIVHVHVDPRVGGAFSFKVRRDGAEIDHVGVYRVIDRPRRLAFSWGIAGQAGSSEVTVDVTPTAGGCDVTVRHVMGAEWADFVARSAEAWTKMMGALDEELGAH
jgi:uncharacterized protein YndB with AHSA1/START domain